jgi:hypothetical protein
MSLHDRRLGFRVPLQIFLTQYIRDRPVRALTTNVSDTGIFLQSVKMPWLRELGEDGAAIGLEFELPGTGETIWARGEICHASTDPMVQSTGIRFTGIPTLHARMIRDYCIESRRGELSSLLSRIRRPELPLPH